MEILGYGTALSQEMLNHRQTRAHWRFPELTSRTSKDYIGLSLYADSIPERFLNIQASDAMLEILVEESQLRGDVLAQGFKNHRGDLQIAFRALGEINSMPGHDAEWPGFEDMRELQIVDRDVHPSYLKLCEAVLGALLRPVAVRERYLRQEKDLEVRLSQKIEESARTKLAPHLHAYNRNLRNAIAHGRVVYDQHAIIYTDRKIELRLAPRDVVKKFDDLLDLCNGLASAYRRFFLESAPYLCAHDVQPPTHLQLDELRTVCFAPSWSVAGCLEFEGTQGRQLTIYATNHYYDTQKVYYCALTTAVAAERLLPGFARYFLSIRGPGPTPSMVAFDGPTLAQFRARGSSDIGDLANVVQDNVIMLSPPFLNPMLRPPASLAKVGTLTEVLRTRLAARRAGTAVVGGHELCLRASQIHRKGSFAFVESRAVLECSDAREASRVIRRFAASIVETAVRHARRRGSEGRSTLARVLPISACIVHIFLSDFRARTLCNYGLGDQLLCKITLKKRGELRIVGFFGGTHERVGDCHVHWNTKAIPAEDLELEQSSS